MMNLTYLPMMNSDIVTGVSLMLLFTFFHFELGFVTLLLSHITFCIPYVILAVMPKLYGMNRNTFEAALDLGATQFEAYKKVVLPDILPGIISGFLGGAIYNRFYNFFCFNTCCTKNSWCNRTYHSSIFIYILW